MLNFEILLNVKPLEERFSNLTKSVHTALMQGGDGVGYVVIKLTMPFVPKRYGFLRHATPFIEGHNNLVIYRIQYSALDYIRQKYNYAYVQEVHEFSHYTTPGTGSRYVEKGRERFEPKIVEMIGRIVKEGMRL